MSVRIDIQYEGNLHCKATHAPSGVTLETDAPADNSGKGESFSPTDLLAASLGTCAVTIMGLVAERDGLNIEGTTVSVIKEMADAPKRRVSMLALTITFPKSANLSVDKRSKLERVINSCPVKQSLHPDVEVKTSFKYL